MVGKTQPKEGRWQFLDAIRGIAALAVVIQHIFWFVSPKIENVFATIWSPGRFGVVAFFIVSGFIVPQSLEHKGDVKAFWTSRFYRLYPAYWVSLALIAAVFALGLAWHPPVDKRYLVQWLVNLTMLQGFARMPDINPVAWTLGLEMVLYAAITVAFMKGFLKQTWLISLSLLFLLAMASTVLPGVFHIRFPAGAAAVCGSIILGLTLFRWFTGELEKRDTVILGFFCFAVTLISSLVNYRPERLSSDPLQPTQLCAITSVVAGYLFFLGMMWFKRPSYPAWILWLGKVSYSLYLLHPVAGMLVPKAMNEWVRAVLEIVLSLVLAWAGYTFVEKPSISLGKAKVARLRPASETA